LCLNRSGRNSGGADFHKLGCGQTGRAKQRQGNKNENVSSGYYEQDAGNETKENVYEQFTLHFDAIAGLVKFLIS